MYFGYECVSIDDQNLLLLKRGLEKAGRKKIFSDNNSTVKCL